MKKLLFCITLFQLICLYAANRSIAADAFDATVIQIKALEVESAQNQALIEEKQTLINDQLDVFRENHTLNAPKGEFESDEDYVARLNRLATMVSQRRAKLEEQHLTAILERKLEIQTESARLHRTVFLTNEVTATLGTYDANGEFFPVAIKANNQFFSRSLYINKDDAPHLKEEWNNVIKMAYISIDPGYRRGLAMVKLEYPPLWNQGVTWTFNTVYYLGNNNSLAFSPDGKYLATGSNDEYGIATIWKVENGEKFRKMDHGDWVYAVAFSPDGRYFATAGEDETRERHHGKAILWEMSNGGRIHNLNHPSYVYAVTFSPNGDYLATARRPERHTGRANLWRVYNGHWTRSMSYLANHRTIYALAFSANGVYLATGNVRAQRHWLDKATLWRVSTGNAWNLEHKNGVYACAFSPNGRYFATGNNGSVTLWDLWVGGGRSVRQIDLPNTVAYTVTFSPDGEYLAIGKSNGYINFFRIGTEEITLETEIPREKSINTGSEVWDLAWHPNGNLISDGKKVYRTVLQPILTDIVAKPLDTRRDVNRDGVVDVDDLVLVASNFGNSFNADANPNPDVNRDGVVNREDVLEIIIALEEVAELPAAPSQMIPTLNADDLRHWINQAKKLNNKEETFQKGIRTLEQLLATLTLAETIPDTTALLPNYPNPFNPETWIPYRLATDAPVRLCIYDRSGCPVRTINLGHRVAGVYERRGEAIYWDGRNNLGERVTSGLYFYTLTAGDYAATRRMLVGK